MGFEVLIFALAGIQHTWPGSNKHTNRIVGDLRIQISNRDHQTVVQSWAQSLPFHTTALWLQLSPSPQRNKEKGVSQTERESWKAGTGRCEWRQKDVENERSNRETKTVAGGEYRDGEERREGRKKYLSPPPRAVDTVSVAAIRVRKTHQRFVCSVRVN